ncbi:hypothetical protein [Polaribacter sp. HL-MS24]|uniref:hypothetical protein n=1 Tax=Polaribacter sp. HL-MS24 TaxID=3077735 RepID=UPI0029348A1C|nr:hypothetical protein [Polaribacter sp. HL-MS24]WOC39926.1 hypothetical protein RRF69_09925 [Polaribacter sp. HL-MS24]
MTKQSIYKEIKPREELKDFIRSFWMHTNCTDQIENTTIVSDYYYNIGCKIVR